MLQITTDEWGNKTKDEFNIASSSASPYTPLYNYFDNYHVEDSGIYLYHKPTIKKQRYASTFSSSNFYQHLNYSLDFERYKLSRTNETEIFVGKGCIYDADGKLLLMLSCKAGSTIEFVNYNSPTKENAKNLTLFISTELLLNPTYNLFYKNLDKNYIKEAFMIDLPVIYTTSEEIERLHYSNDFKVEFNQISEFENHLKNNVGRIFKMSNEDFQTFNPGIGKDFQEVIPVPEVEELDINRERFNLVMDESYGQQLLTGTSSITINSQGNVGINSGIVNPSTPLHVNSTTSNIGYSIGVDPYLSVNGSITTLQTDASGLVINHDYQQTVIEDVIPPTTIEEVLSDFDFIDDTEEISF